jgi:hypothetical protein
MAIQLTRVGIFTKLDRIQQALPSTRIWAAHRLPV